MLNKIKNLLSNFPLLYNFVKKFKQDLSNNKIYYIISKSDIDKFNFKNFSYKTFNEKNLAKLYTKYEDYYIFITDKNIVKKYSTERLERLFWGFRCA